MLESKINSYLLPRLPNIQQSKYPRNQSTRNVLSTYLQTLRMSSKDKNTQLSKKQKTKIEGYHHFLQISQRSLKKQKKLGAKAFQNQLVTEKEVVDIYVSENQNCSNKTVFVREIVTTIKPPHRYKTSLGAYQNSLLVYGGLGCEKNLSWAILDFSTLNWTIADHNESNQLKKYSPPIPLYGHSLKIYKQNAFIYGGLCYDVLNNLTIFNIKYKTSQPGAIAPFRRRQHATAIAHHYMIVHGGLQMAHQVHKQMFYYNIQNNKWQTINSRDLPCLYNHSMLYYQCKNKKKPKKFYQLSIGNIYIFGGKNELGHCQNKLYKIRVKDENQVSVSQIKSSRAPQPRHSFCMEAISTNYFMVYGGKYTQQKDSNNVIGGVYKDFFLFDIQRQQWIQPELTSVLQPRYGMSSAIQAGYVFIFGGFGPKCYHNANITKFKLGQFGQIYNSTNKNVPIQEKENYISNKGIIDEVFY